MRRRRSRGPARSQSVSQSLGLPAPPAHELSSKVSQIVCASALRICRHSTDDEAGRGSGD